VGLVPNRCFVSYRRDDNSAFNNVVDHLCEQMRAIYEAHTGDELEIFLDRTSIGWGENWREKISEAIDGAVLFVPIITMRYFKSEACTDELLAFTRQRRPRG